MKVEIDIQSDFTVDEGVRIMEQIYKDYRIRNITVQEFNDAWTVDGCGASVNGGIQLKF